jgi:hypothetical protein
MKNKGAGHIRRRQRLCRDMGRKAQGFGVMQGAQQSLSMTEGLMRGAGRSCRSGVQKVFC